MSSNAHTHPFAPNGSPTVAQLKAYIEGTLAPAEQHFVEQHLENDPFLQEALEGLQEPDSIAAFATLERPNYANGPSGSSSLFVVVSALVALTGSVLFFSLDNDRPIAQTPIEVAHAKPNASTPKEHFIEPPVEPVAFDEIAASQQLAETLQIGHQPSDLHTKEMEQFMTDVERVTVDRIAPMEPNVAVEGSLTKPDVTPVKRTSVQLLYLYDLKLVDPIELYTRAAMLTISENGIDARYADKNEQEAARKGERLMAYTPYMKSAMFKFTQKDHKGCLTDLQRVLQQYPDDVNAQFYSGLCCYNLGLYKKAERYLAAARSNAIDVFNEEADWYHALTLRSTGRTEDHLAALKRIATAKGFYAERAEAALAKK